MNYPKQTPVSKPPRPLFGARQQLFDNLAIEKQMQSEIMQAMAQILEKCCEKYGINMQRISDFSTQHRLGLDLTKIIIMEQKDAPIIIDILASHGINEKNNHGGFPDRTVLTGTKADPFYSPFLDLSFVVCDYDGFDKYNYEDQSLFKEAGIIHELCHQKRGLYSATKFPTTGVTAFTRGGLRVRHYDHQDKTFGIVLGSFLEEGWVRYIQGMYVDTYRTAETKDLLRQLAHRQIPRDQYGFLYRYLYITARPNGQKTYSSDMNSLMGVGIDLLIQNIQKTQKHINLYELLLQSRSSDYDTALSAHKAIIKILAGCNITKPNGKTSNLYRELMKLQYPNDTDTITGYQMICQALGVSSPLRF